MSVAEIAQLHTRYVRLSEKFKAIWTYHQFATGVYKNLLQQQLPYDINFQNAFEAIKAAGDQIQSAPALAVQGMNRSDTTLEKSLTQLASADRAITPSILRRFFEKLRSHDEKIVFNLVKFYLYAGAVDGEQRDKLDFLFTKIGEDFIEERGEYALRDSLELRRQLQSLVTAWPGSLPDASELHELLASIRIMQDEIDQVLVFEQFTDDNLLTRAREMKHRIGERFLSPDVLLALITLNVATKNRFAKLYRAEEERILLDAHRILENEETISSQLRDEHPELLLEIDRFKRFKQEFDDSRASSNVKHHVITELKMSLNSLLSQLDRDLAAPVEESEIFSQIDDSDSVLTRFGDDQLLLPYLERMHSILSSFDDDLSAAELIVTPAARGLRLETWEVEAYRSLYEGTRRGSGDLALLFLRAAALRMKVEEEAGKLVAAEKGNVDDDLLAAVSESLDRSKAYDNAFKEFLQDGLTNTDPADVHKVYRSRVRLMRGFSGLWLIYDQHAPVE